MQLTEVTTKSLEKDFIKVNVLMNKSNPNYIRPLDKEIYEVFDKSQNKYYETGEAKRWILKNIKGNLIGRIAAFTNKKYVNNGTDYLTGGTGFFDCINNQQAANILFDNAKEWLQGKGMEAMDGPINFGDRDKWWGLMVEGFEKEPIYGMPFNPAYYEKLFENYGFKNYYNQYYYGRIVAEPLDERFPQRYAKFKEKPEYSARHIDKKNIEKYAEDFATVYNAAWSQHQEFKEITKPEVMKLFKKMKPVMDERIIWYAYYKDEPIALWVNIPDLNQYFKHFNGKFGLIEKLRFLWMKKRNVCRIFTGVAFGIVPKYQKLGVDSFMIFESSFIIKALPLIYDFLEMGWAGDWNPRMISVYKALDATQSRRMVTYRYIFNDKYPFERHPVLEYK